MNPWVSIWTHPRATTRLMLERQTARGTLPLAVLGGIAAVCNVHFTKALARPLPISLLIGAAVGGLVGVAWLYAGAGLFAWLGRRFGGQGTAAHLRIALAWSWVPVIWRMLLWIPALLIFGPAFLAQATPTIPTSTGLQRLWWGSLGIEGVMTLWGVVVLSHAIGAAHRFSGWKGFATALLGGLLAGLALMLLVSPFLPWLKQCVGACG